MPAYRPASGGRRKDWMGIPEGEKPGSGNGKKKERREDMYNNQERRDVYPGPGKPKPRPVNPGPGKKRPPVQPRPMPKNGPREDKRRTPEERSFLREQQQMPNPRSGPRRTPPKPGSGYDGSKSKPSRGSAKAKPVVTGGSGRMGRVGR